MAETDSQWQSWLHHLVDGDDAVVREFWREYGPRLERLAAQHLGARVQRREGPEDVVQSVCRTFFRRAREGQFDLADRGSLWRLLCAITLTRVRQKVRYHLRDRRSLQKEQRLAATPDDSLPGVREVAAVEPTPAEAVAMADQIERLAAGMDDEERQILALKLERSTNEEIAGRLGCSERTVRRIAKRTQARLRRILDESVLGGVAGERDE